MAKSTQARTKIVTVHEAKTQLSALIRLVEAGSEVVIARGRHPVVRIVPWRRFTKKRTFGAMKGKAAVDAAFFEPLPESELNPWE